MGKIAKVAKPGKLNEIVFQAYQTAINNRMKAGHDVNVMVNRLNKLISDRNRRQFVFKAELGLIPFIPTRLNFNMENNMKMEKWSGYASYLTLSDKSGAKLKGNFTTYQEFKVIKDVINNISFSDKNTYLHNGNIYNRKITSQEAKNILANIDDCKWTDTTSKMLLVANQLKLRI